MPIELHPQDVTTDRDYEPAYSGRYSVGNSVLEVVLSGGVIGRFSAPCDRHFAVIARRGHDL